MRRLLTAVAMSAIALGFSACAEVDTPAPVEEPVTNTFQVTVEAEDGTEFDVTVTQDGQWTQDQVMDYVANIEVTVADDDTFAHADATGVYTAVPAVSQTVDSIAEAGGFEIHVERVNEIQEIGEDYMWNFSDLNHALGHCP